MTTGAELDEFDPVSAAEWEAEVMERLDGVHERLDLLGKALTPKPGKPGPEPLLDEMKALRAAIDELPNLKAFERASEAGSRLASVKAAREVSSSVEEMTKVREAVRAMVQAVEPAREALEGVQGRLNRAKRWMRLAVLITVFIAVPAAFVAGFSVGLNPAAIQTAMKNETTCKFLGFNWGTTPSGHFCFLQMPLE